jgi:DNA polymerase-4
VAEPLARVVLHLDMDAFYASVEVRENPALKGRPVIVGHPGRRGVVATCSYEARKFGVRSAMPSLIAMRLCPDAVWLPGRMGLYAEVSRAVRRLMEDAAPLVEPLSIDEAFLDLTGLASSLEDGAARARALKQAIAAQERLTCSIGVAPNKFLAKVASDMEKPDGLVVFPLEDVPRRLWPMPVERLWGVGPKTAARLRLGGLVTVGDLAKVTDEAVASLVGANQARHLCALARGRDERRVVRDHAAKSISEERTYAHDLEDPERIDRAVLERAEGVARQLRRSGLVARTVHLKVRTGDFTTWTRAHSLPAPTDLAEALVQAGRMLLRDKVDLGGRGIRLLGLGVSGIERRERVPGDLFADPGEERARRMARAADAVRERLGERAVTRARLLDRGEDDEASTLPSVD